MKLLSLLFMSLGMVLADEAQMKVSGTIKDYRGKPVAGASITIKDSYDGATTDSLGRFQFRASEKGSHQLVFSSVGYKELIQEVMVEDKPVTINVVLKEKLDELKAVMVTAGTFAAGDRKQAATVLNSIDVATVGGANADITAAVKTLPGAQQVGEQEGLFVRGGAGYETKQIIDGTVVNNPFYSSAPDIASRGRFSPFLFKGNVFSTGGYSALYGQALSSVLLLESIDMPEKSQASASLSSVFVGGGYQKLARNGKALWGANYGLTNLRPYFELIKQKPDYFIVPELHGGDANFRIKTKGGIIKFYTAISTLHTGMRRPDIDSIELKNAFELKNLNWYNNLSWRENLGNGWKLNAGLSFSTNHDQINQEVQNSTNQKILSGFNYIDNKNFSLDNTNNLAQIRAVIEKRLRGISTIRLGSEYWHNYQKSIYNERPVILQDHFNAVFAETDIYITNGLAAKLGARYEYSSLLKRSNVAPRISLAYKTGKDAQMSFAYGTFYQKPENTWLMASANLRYTRATHYLANYIRTKDYYKCNVAGFKYQ